jgi:hypothetical protein
MPSFERECVCADCGRFYVVSGESLNPGNETQEPALFSCACGGPMTVFVPGSANRERLKLTPKRALKPA